MGEFACKAKRWGARSLRRAGPPGGAARFIQWDQPVSSPLVPRRHAARKVDIQSGYYIDAANGLWDLAAHALRQVGSGSKPSFRAVTTWGMSEQLWGEPAYSAARARGELPGGMTMPN